MPWGETTLPTTFYPSYNAGVIPSPVYAVSINWGVNRTPLYSRLPEVPVSSVEFKWNNDGFRPRSTTLNNAGSLLIGATSATVADGTIFQIGDVIQIEAEQILVTNVVGNVLTITRGYAGTAAAAHADLLAVLVIGNTATGAEVGRAGISRLPVAATNWCSTIQFPYQVGGSLNTSGAYVSGYGTPLQRDKYIAMMSAMDDAETQMLFGGGVAPSAGGRPMMKGLRTLITTNKVTAPTNAGSYKPSDLIRDTVQASRANGGAPDTLMVSTNFMTGLSIWGHNAQRLDVGATAYGVAIDAFYVPFLPALKIIECPLLPQGTVVCLQSQEVRKRVKRALFDKPRGSRGDAEEGDLIMELSIELNNEAHHAWVEGITAFAPA